ncbi:MAG: hypothetical protein KDA61_10765, partial [Planctomycetales bacterium]|nr:hypothetical protein [Planctomycetales bacterium]
KRQELPRVSEEPNGGQLVQLAGAPAMHVHASQCPFPDSFQPSYDHTQHSPLPWLAFGITGACLVIAAFVATAPEWIYIGPICIVLVTLIGFCFSSLRVVDEADSLVARFGAIPLFRKRIAYSDIASAVATQICVIDGWGIHWTPLRGWTYNVWGFGCVLLQLNNGNKLRIGSDEPSELAAFLQKRIGRNPDIGTAYEKGEADVD